MTVLAAVIDRQNHAAWMASDSWATSGAMVHSVTSKITRIGAALVGTCGVPSGERFLRRYDALPAEADHPATVAWVDDLAGRWRSWARDEHLTDKDSGDPPWWAIVATPQGLWHLGSDGSVVEVADDYTAQGSGAMAALGVLWCSRANLCGEKSPGHPFPVLRRAIEAAIDHGDGCGGAVLWEATP